MRIGINAAFLGRKLDGLSTYTRAVVEDLSCNGDEVLVYTSKPLKMKGNGLTRWRRTPSSIGSENGTSGNALRTLLWSQAALPAHVLRDRPQVLLCTMPEGMLVPVCPQVIVVHDLIPLLCPEASSRWTYYFRYVLPYVLRASRRVIAVSKHTKKDLVEHLEVPEEKIDVIYPWVNPAFLAEDSGKPLDDVDSKSYFLFVGRPSPHKNLAMVIRAFASISSDVSHRLVCVLGFSCEADQKYYSDILQLASRLGVRDRLRIYSGISRAQLLYLYRHATALVLLSKYEGFGFPPLEAMAVGTPAIVSNSTSLAEVAGPAAVCVPNNEPEPAAEAMRRSACDSSFRAEISHAAIMHARQFTRERSGRMIRSVLERCATSI